MRSLVPYASLPARTAAVIFTGHPDPRRMASLNARKVACESRAGRWTRWIDPSDGRALEEVEKAKHRLLFLGIK